MKLQEQASAIQQAREVLQRLYLHHESQAKSWTAPVTKTYNADLGKQAKAAFNALGEAFS